MAYEGPDPFRIQSGGTATSSFNIHGIVVSGATTTSPLSALTLTDGQIVIGSTGGAPAAGTLTAGTGITITNAANSITIATSGTVLSALSPDNGADLTPTAGVIDIRGVTGITDVPSGIETHNNGTSVMYLEDRRWITAFVVDPSTTIGLRGTFSTIQTAVTAAGAGPADIYIRPGSYTENLTLTGNVNLIATSVSGDPDPTVIAHVFVSGDHTVTGNALTVCSGIRFVSSGTNFTLADAGGGIAAMQLINCTIDSTGSNFSLGNGSGSGSVKMQNCTLTSNNRSIIVPTGSVGGNYNLLDSSISSAGDGAIYIDGNLSTGIVDNCSLIGAGSSPFTFDFNAAACTLDLKNSYLEAPGTATIMFQSAATVKSYHNTHNTGGASEYIIGPGNYSYCDDVLIGGYLNSGIDNAATQTIAGWRPWSNAVASPALDGVRGTCCFDSASFTVLDGFVTLSGAGTGITQLVDDSAVPTTGTSITLVGADGIVTGDAGAGTITIDDKRWLSAFVVDSTAVFGSNNAEYTTIQAAYNAADTAGGGTIYIRANPAGAYSENLTLTSNNTINFIGVNGDATSGSTLVTLAGTATVSGTGIHTFANMDILGSIDSPFNFTSAGTMQFLFENCNINSFANNAFNQPSGDLTLKVNNCYVNGIIDTCRFDGNTIQATFTDSLIGSNTNSAVEQTSAGTSAYRNCTFIGANFGLNVNLGSVDLADCSVQSTNECINLAIGGSARLFNVKLFTSAISGFTVTGTGQLIYIGIQSEANTTLNPALSLTPLDWQPYAKSAVAPATPAAGQGLRGTACFDVSQFTVTNGFVQLNASGVPETLTGNSGGAVSPTANNINTVGTGSITIVGNPGTSTLTTQLTGLTNHSLLVGAGTATITNLGVATNGQLPIGSTGANPVLATLTSAGSTISITNGAGSISLDVNGSSVGKTITGDSGGALSPTAGNWNIIGGTVAAGTSPLKTAGSGSTLTINAQTSQALAAADATKIGLSNFDSSSFAVAATGFVTLSTTGVLKTLTGNSGGAISPTANNINTVGTGSITIAGSGSTLTTQLTGLTNHSLLVGAGTATMTNLGVATNGQLPIGSTGADPVLATLTAGTGVSITNGAGSITIAATASVSPWTDVSGTVTAVSNNGYFVTGTTTSTLPASPTQGDIVWYVVDTTNLLTITAAGTQLIRVGNNISAAGGTCVSSQRGDAIQLVYRASGTTWFAANSPVGAWTTT